MPTISRSRVQTDDLTSNTLHDVPTNPKAAHRSAPRDTALLHTRAIPLPTVQLKLDPFQVSCSRVDSSKVGSSASILRRTSGNWRAVLLGLEQHAIDLGACIEGHASSHGVKETVGEFSKLDVGFF